MDAIDIPRKVIDQTPAPFCSDRCRFAHCRSSHKAIDQLCNPSWSTPRCLPPAPTNSASAVHGSQEDGDHSSEPSAESHSSPSPDTDCAARAYSHLCVIYDFTPPPTLPFASKVTTSSVEPVPRFDGGIIMAARRIQAALCIDKPKKSSWGVPNHSESEDYNKPIPGWTDGSNAWRSSVYGLAPPRDFNRIDPDDAAIRAYGSYVATPHRSRGVHSTLNKSKPTTSSSYLPSSGADASTQKLCHQYWASFAQRSRSRNLRNAGSSTSRTGSTRRSPREVPLLKPGAEGRLLVPNVKMRLPNPPFSNVGGSSGACDTLGVERLYRVPGQQNSDAGRNANRTQSYESEAITYPIMRRPPKEERHVERRVIDGVECEVEVVVLIEEPIKRLFLFGGARD